MRKRLLYLAAALCLGLALMAGTVRADGSAVEDVQVEADGVTVQALADQDCTLLAALYDRDGRMVDVQTAEVKAGTPLENTKLIWDAQQAEAAKIKVFLVDANVTSKPVSRACELPILQEDGDFPVAGMDYAVLLGTDWGAFGTHAKLLFADGTKKVIDLDPGYGNAYDLMAGELYTYDTNANGEYQLDPVPVDKYSSGFDYTKQGGSVQPQSDTNRNAGYIDGYEIADDAVIFVRYDDGNSYKAITGTNLCAMSAGDFTCSYVLATGSTAGAGKVNLAYVTANRHTIVSPSPQRFESEPGYAVLLGTNQDAFGNQAKLLFADGSKKIVDLDTSNGDFWNLQYGQLFAYETNADGEYRLSEIPADSAASGYDYTRQGGEIQKQSNTNAKAGYIDGYEIADDAVIFVQYGGGGGGSAPAHLAQYYGGSYKVITGKDLRTMPAADFVCNYVLATGKVGAGKVDLAYVSTDRAEIAGGDSGDAVVDQGFAVLISWTSGAFSDQAKLLFADGTKKVVDLDSSVYYQDGYVSAYELMPEWIYSCEVTGDGEYRLKALTGYDVIQQGGTIQPQSDTNANAGYIDNREIADDAVVFLQYGPSSFKVITGAELRTMDSNAHSVMYYAANDKVAMAFVAQGGGGSSRPSVRTESQYYYIDDVQEEEVDNKTFYHVYGNMGGGLDDYSVESSVWPGLEKGSVIAVEVDRSDRSIREISQYVTPDDMVAITEVSGDALTIDGSGTYFMAQNVGIVAVDFARKESVDSLGWDEYVDSGITLAKTSDDGAYIPNAMVLFNNDGEIAFIAYDCEKITE